LSYLMQACHAGEATVLSNPCTGVKICGRHGICSQLCLPVCHRGSLPYLAVEFLVSPLPGGGGAGAANHFLIYSVTYIFHYISRCLLPGFWFSVLFLNLLICMYSVLYYSNPNSESHVRMLLSLCCLHYWGFLYFYFGTCLVRSFVHF
jgi:hypothetical protein